MLCCLSSSIWAWITQVFLFSVGYFSREIYQTLGRLSDLTPALLSPPGTDRSWQGKGTPGSCCSILLRDERKRWLIKSASLLVGEHSKCGKINKNKSMYVKSAPCHCWPNLPAELQEPFSCWFVLFAHTTVMWYKVICVPGAAVGKSSLELAEGQCGTGLKSDLCLVTVQEMLVLILGWQKSHNSLCTSSLLIPCELSKWFPERLQSEKKIAIVLKSS